jgi:hypothetical protein
MSVGGWIGDGGHTTAGKQWFRERNLFKEACSFLKKRTKRLLFLGQLPGSRPWHDISERAGSKSPLLLFFRKEDFS